MFTPIDAQLARHRYEEMIQEAERERRFANSATVQVNPVANAINALKTAFTRREQARQAARHTLAAE